MIATIDVTLISSAIALADAPAILLNADDTLTLRLAMPPFATPR